MLVAGEYFHSSSSELCRFFLMHTPRMGMRLVRLACRRAHGTDMRDIQIDSKSLHGASFLAQRAGALCARVFSTTRRFALSFPHIGRSPLSDECLLTHSLIGSQAAAPPASSASRAGTFFENRKKRKLPLPERWTDDKPSGAPARHRVPTPGVPATFRKLEFLDAAASRAAPVGKFKFLCYHSHSTVSHSRSKKPSKPKRF